MRLRFAAFGFALAGVFSPGCGGIIDPSQNQMSTVAGTLQPGGLNKQPFSSGSGEILVKVGTLTPASTQVIGIEWVQAGDGSCNGNVLGNNQFVTANTTAISGQISSGSYCLIVYDPIVYPQPVNYSITLSHP